MTRRISMKRPMDWLSSAGRKARIKSRRRCLLFALAVMSVVVPAYYGLAFGRVVLNGSDSLNDNAFIMVTWPKIVVPGAVVAMKMPEVLRAGLDLEEGQAVYVKRVLGVAGDVVVQHQSSVCIKDRCLERFERAEVPALALWSGSVVPEQTVFVAGDSSSSLDSRYALIGPRSMGDVIAVGVPLALPDWRRLRTILDGGG